MERLQKVMAAAGVASRRGAEALIAEGRVTVNGVVADLGQKVDQNSDEILVDGQPLPRPAADTYYLVHKPAGVVSTVRDTHGRRTVIDLIPPEPRVVPVGRLDVDTTGLLILTNDGELTLRLTHPRYEVPKRYRATVLGEVTDADCRRLTDGIDLEDGPARAVDARVISSDGSESIVAVVLTEGRKREVRRMMEAIGYPVAALHRTSIGPIHDPDLSSGAWRHLTDEEVEALYAAAADAD